MFTHHGDVIMGPITYQITSPTIVYSTVYSDADQGKHQSSASLAFVQGIHPVNSPHKWPVTRKMFPFDDVIMQPDSSTTARFKITWSTCMIHYNQFLCDSPGFLCCTRHFSYRPYWFLRDCSLMTFLILSFALCDNIHSRNESVTLLFQISLMVDN